MSDVIIGPDDYVTVTKMGHLVEVQHMEKRNDRNNIKKLNEDEYLVLETGEIKEFDRTENRSEGQNSLRQTFKKLRYLINNNFKGLSNELHMTLTYADNMQDVKRLYDDVRKFIMRLKYTYREQTSIDYINVVEPQQRGAWHCHVLVRFNDLKTVYVENSKLAKIWGHGFVNIRTLKNVDNIGAYLSAYLADIELTEENGLDSIGREVEEKNVNGEKKKFIKGGRLHMYPSGMNIYRKSRGCKYPDRKVIKYKDIKKIVGPAKPHYEKIKTIDTDDFTNKITYLQYNMKRT